MSVFVCVCDGFRQKEALKHHMINSLRCEMEDRLWPIPRSEKEREREMKRLLERFQMELDI